MSSFYLCLSPPSYLHLPQTYWLFRDNRITVIYKAFFAHFDGNEFSVKTPKSFCFHSPITSHFTLFYYNLSMPHLKSSLNSSFLQFYLKNQLLVHHNYFTNMCLIKICWIPLPAHWLQDTFKTSRSEAKKNNLVLEFIVQHEELDGREAEGGISLKKLFFYRFMPVN